MKSKTEKQVKAVSQVFDVRMRITTECAERTNAVIIGNWLDAQFAGADLGKVRVDIVMEHPDTQEVIRPTVKGEFPVLADGIHQVALGNGTQFTVMVIHRNGSMHIGVLGKGYYSFISRVNTDYVAEKLRLRPMLGDAANMADLINSQFDFVAVPPCGIYQANFCQ